MDLGVLSRSIQTVKDGWAASAHAGNPRLGQWRLNPGRSPIATTRGRGGVLRAEGNPCRTVH